MLLDHTKLTSIDQRLQAHKGGLEGEEQLRLSLEGKVRAEGDEEDLYILWVDPFGVYSHYGERAKALELLDQISSLKASAEVDCSLLIAQWLYDSFDEIHLTQVYIDRAYVVDPQKSNNRNREFRVHRLKCLELDLHARHNPTSPRLVTLLTEIEAATGDTSRGDTSRGDTSRGDTSRGDTSRVDERLVSALRRLASSGIAPLQVRGILEKLNTQFSEQSEMDRYDTALKAEIDEAISLIVS
jgi:hypothetical protein